MTSVDEMIEVFRTTDAALAQMAVDEVLTPAEIPSVVHDRFSKSFPTPATGSGGFFIAVPANKAADAIAALKEAQAEGILPNDGEVT